jgi:hypothetical protein
MRHSGSGEEVAGVLIEWCVMRNLDAMSVVE